MSGSQLAMGNDSGAAWYALRTRSRHEKVVRDQLRPQQIYFPAQGKALPPSLNQYAGQQVDTAKEVVLAGYQGQGIGSPCPGSRKLMVSFPGDRLKWLAMCTRG